MDHIIVVVVPVAVLLIVFVSVILLIRFIRKERARTRASRIWKKAVAKRHKRFVKYIKTQQKIAKKAGDKKQKNLLLHFRKVKHDKG